MKQVLTLLYHRINKPDQDLHLLSVTPDNFYEQMAYIKKNYPIIKLEEDWNKICEPSIVITFDDGYADNYHIVAPILEELQIPATIFVTTGTLDSKQELWWDELERLLLVGDDIPTALQLDDSLFSCKWETDSFDKRKSLYFTLHWLMYNQIDLTSRQSWLKQLCQWRHIGNNGRHENLIMSSQQCQNINTSNYIGIGAHTVNHPSLASLDYTKQKEEIESSLLTLEFLLKEKVRTFSYPFGGKKDYNTDTIKICKQLGFIKAVANVPGYWQPGMSLFEIPRNIVRNWEISQFKQELHNFWHIT